MKDVRHLRQESRIKRLFPVYYAKWSREFMRKLFGELNFRQVKGLPQ